MTNIDTWAVTRVMRVEPVFTLFDEETKARLLGVANWTPLAVGIRKNSRLTSLNHLSSLQRAVAASWGLRI